MKKEIQLERIYSDYADDHLFLARIDSIIYQITSIDYLNKKIYVINSSQDGVPYIDRFNFDEAYVFMLNFENEKEMRNFLHFNRGFTKETRDKKYKDLKMVLNILRDNYE